MTGTLAAGRVLPGTPWKRASHLFERNVLVYRTANSDFQILSAR